MNNLNFYTFESTLKNGTIQLRSKEKFDLEKYLLNRIENTKCFQFNYYSGKKVFDIVDISFAGIYLISKKVVESFKKNKLTGWKTYNAQFRNEDNEIFYSHKLIGVTGKAGTIERNLSEIITYPPKGPGGKTSKYYKGTFFNLNTWDKTDFFRLEGTRGIIVSQNVKNVINEINATNFSLKPLSEIEHRILE